MKALIAIFIVIVVFVGMGIVLEAYTSRSVVNTQAFSQNQATSATYR